MPPTRTEIQARRRVAAIRRSLNDDMRRMREDAGVSQSRLARAAGIAQGYLSRIEAGTVAPSLETYARLSAALGADLACRLYPNTGPAIRDRHQASIAQALVRAADPRWQCWPEVAVRRPARGWIDLVFHDPVERVAIATEIESEIRRIEQLLRWHAEKAASLPSADAWPYGPGDTAEISRLMVVRATRATRSLAREFADLLAVAFPGSPTAALAALSGRGRWPGSSLLWAHDAPAGYRVAASPTAGGS
jgi:transcriptional regulator with XRE-family HTH domain